MDNNNSTKPQGTYQTPQGVFTGTPPIAYPVTPGYTPPTNVAVGGEVLASTVVEYNTGRNTARVRVKNTGDRPIQVGSHFHFFEVNRYLEFDRTAAFGCHLNIPATTAIRFEPGDVKEVELVSYSGKRRVVGFNGLVNGYTGGEDMPTYFPVRIKAMKRMQKLGFKNSSETQAESGAAQNNIKK